MEFSEAVRRTMFEFGLTATELSRRSGINHSQINEFKNGNRELRSNNLHKLLEAMDADARHFCLKLAFPEAAKT